MSHVPGNLFRRPDDGRGRWTDAWIDVADVVRKAGVKGVLALLLAAAVAFAPLAMLIWFNVLRLLPVNAVLAAPHVRVKPLRHQTDAESDSAEDEPGETGLLHIACDVPGSGGWQPLLDDDDPAHSTDFLASSVFTRQEGVYLRPKLPLEVPFGLLGPPPVCAWLPAGDYEVIVVYHAPRNSPLDLDDRPLAYPFVTAAAECQVENKRRTALRLPLPHYLHSFGPPIKLPGDERRMLTPDDMGGLIASIEQCRPISTPGGVLLALREPLVRHEEGHQNCIVDFSAGELSAREWTDEQLGDLQRWLPQNAVAARTKLEHLRGQLGWRRFFAGWYCYAAAGVAGLVFTRWGAIFLLEPFRSKAEFARSVRILVLVFLASAAAWFAFSVLTSGGCRGGPVPFRLR